MNKEDLINEVIAQVIKDINADDLTAVEELLRHVSDDILIAFLPEEGA